jgi:MoaA/NifB/PqqE/SkfB family radical SAM enzyme
MLERFKFVGVNSITFNQQFKTIENCFAYLSSVKWEEGYSCKRCKDDKYCNGKSCSTGVAPGAAMMKAR